MRKRYLFKFPSGKWYSLRLGEKILFNGRHNEDKSNKKQN